MPRGCGVPTDNSKAPKDPNWNKFTVELAHGASSKEILLTREVAGTGAFHLSPLPSCTQNVPFAS